MATPQMIQKVFLLLSLCLTGCLVPADRARDDSEPGQPDAPILEETAFRAAHNYNRELARIFRELAAQAESGTGDATLARNQEAAVSAARQSFAPVARLFDEHVKRSGTFDNRAAATAYREIAAGYDRAARQSAHGNE